MVSPLLLRAGLNYQLRHRWQAFLALVGIAMGVAIVLAIDLATGAARASFEQSAAELRGAATHRVTGVDGRVPTAWYRQLATTAGMPPAAPVISAPALLGHDAQPVRLLGLDLFAERRFRQQMQQRVGETDLRDWLTDPRLAMLSDVLAESLGKKPGDPLELRMQGHTHRMKLADVYPQQAAAGSDLVLVDIATAQQLLGMQGFISHVDLIADTVSSEAVRAILPPSLRLVDIETQTASTVGLSAAFDLNLTAMGLLALVVGMFLIFNAMSFSIVQRRNLFGRLRALGAQPAEIYRMVLGEALVLAMIGSLVGLLLGILLGKGLTEVVAGTVSELYYQVSANALRVSPWSLLKGLALGLGGTLVAALFPAWQAASTPPVSSLSRADLEAQTLRWLLPLAVGGIALCLFGLALAFLVPGGLLSGLFGLFAVILGAVLVTPSAIPLFQRLLQHLPFQGAWRLAVRDLRRHVSRLGTAAAALMIALSAAVSVTIMVESMRGAVSDWLRSVLNADLYVTAEAIENEATLPPSRVQQLRQLPLISASSRYRHRDVELGGRPVDLVGAELSLPSRQGFRFVAGDSDSAWQGFDQGGLLISEPLANRLRLGPGDHLELASPSGTRSHPIVGVFRDFSSEHGRVFMPWALYSRDWLDDRVDTVAVFSHKASPDELKRAIQQSTGGIPLAFTPANAIYVESMQVFDRTFRVTDVLRTLSLGVAVVGIFSALMAIQLQRRKEFAVLRALGMTRRQLAGLILVESLLLGGIAGLLSLPTGLLMAWVLTEAIQFKAFGWTLPLSASLSPQLATLGLGLLAALLAALYPAWQASRHDPAPSLRED